MKGAILQQLGTPKYDDIDIPKPASEEQVLVRVLTSTIKQLDRSKANGRHYLPYTSFPCAVGVDGVAQLEDGTLIYAMGITGMIAEYALVPKNKWTVLDGDVDPIAAAAIPNALLGAGIALDKRGHLKQGDVVIVNGATGYTGKVALQLAKLNGASTVIAIGRSQSSLQQLVKDNIISATSDYTIQLKYQSDGTLDADSLSNDIGHVIKTIGKPIDIVMDYLWGAPTETIISTLTKFNQPVSHTTRIVSVGEMAGSSIQLKSAFLRGSGIEVVGSGFGSVTAIEIGQYMSANLNRYLKLVKEGKFKLDLTVVPLPEFESYWTNPNSNSRIVVNIQSKK